MELEGGGAFICSFFFSESEGLELKIVKPEIPFKKLWSWRDWNQWSHKDQNSSLHIPGFFLNESMKVLIRESKRSWKVEGG